MDKVTAVMDSVMDQTTDSDECNGADPISENSPGLKNDEVTSFACNRINQLPPEPREDLGNNPSPDQTQSPERETVTDTSDHLLPAVIESVTEDISVGDKVTIENCPGHWLWAQPFEVLSIEGDLAALDLVSELVEIRSLKRC